jgi:hypothetical protein
VPASRRAWKGAFMVLEIIHPIVLTATLTCCLVVAFHARRIHTTSSRELAPLDARGRFVAVGTGGIGQCYAGNGSGFIDAR